MSGDLLAPPSDDLLRREYDRAVAALVRAEAEHDWPAVYRLEDEIAALLREA